MKTMIKVLKGFLVVILIAFLFTNCDDSEIVDDDSDVVIDEDVLAINKWIDDVMTEVYLWEEKMPSIDYQKEEDSEAYFYKLLFEDEDIWSWITDDWESYQNELQGTPNSIGYSPAFGRFSDSDDVFIIVEYVYNDSPAKTAGLKRGDIILTIDGIQLNIDNYYELFSGKSYTVGLGEYLTDQGAIGASDKTIELTAASFTANPILHYEVKDTLGSKVGYIVYTDFTTGVNNSFHDSLDIVMDYFKSEGITDLIVDLRYNPGGELGTAAYLASAIAPNVTVLDEEVLIKMVYNDFVQDYFEQSSEDEEHLQTTFPANESNLNMSRVYFLTSTGTASASELVITGLDPYMDVVQVGDTTHGKYTGAWVIDSDEYNWAVIPVVLKYANANGKGEFRDGLFPDDYVADDMFAAVPFGDINDQILATAMSKITGTNMTANTEKSAKITRRFNRLFPNEMESKKVLKVLQTGREFILIFKTTSFGGGHV